MQIVVNHLTRIHAGYICVAGVELETHRHVRPVLAEGPLPFFLLARYGGPFDVARIVDLGAARPAPDPPHVEDHVFVVTRAKAVRGVSPPEFWGLLEQRSETSLRAIFGDALSAIGRSHYGTAVGRGSASLGCFRPARPPELYLAAGSDKRPRVRMKLSDGQIEADAGVTDVRLYGDDHATPNAELVRAVARRILGSEGVILGLGLTRKFRSSDQTEYRHWLQVNNIHLKEEPAWQVG